MKLNYSNFSSNFNKILASHDNIDKVNKKLAVAVSGGADSLCLTSLLNKYCIENHYDLYAIIIDHDLRPESSEESLTTKEFLASKNIKTSILKWKKTSDIKSNIHQHARNARYELLLKFCQNNEIKILCTAHNYDDQAETVLMRIMRGSGIDGITAIPEVKNSEDILIVRPLLHFKRTDIENYLNSINWRWINDQSNFNTRYARTKTRSILNSFEDKKLIQRRLILLANNADRTKKFLENYTNKIFKSICNINKYGYINVNFQQFIELDEEIALRILIKIFRYVSNIIYPPRLNSILLLLNKLKEQDPFQGRTLCGCEVIKKDNNLIFFRERKEIKGIQKLKNNMWQIWDNRFQIKINSDNYYVSCLSEKIWQEIKQKKFIHSLPLHKIIFTTPIIHSQDKKIIIHPLLNINDKNENSLLNIEVKTNYKG